MKTMRGIEPIIAVVILVAVTLVIAIGVIGWIMGWWGTMGATESLQIYPDSYIDATNATNATLYIYVKNTGSASAVVYKVEIVGVHTASFTETISPGSEKTITVTGLKVVPGTNYAVKIYTKAGKRLYSNRSS